MLTGRYTLDPSPATRTELPGAVLSTLLFLPHVENPVPRAGATTFKGKC